MSKKQNAQTTEVETTEVVQVTVHAPLSAEQLDTEVKRAGSVSALIRELSAKGMSRGQISKYTGKRYQHVRNVLITPIKKSVG